MSGYRVDFTDTRILKLLAKDCRVSYRQIALNLDITTNTVKRRINNLVSRRIIADFLIRVNLGAFGYKNIHNLTIKHKGNRDQLEKYLRNLGYVFQEGSCVGGISRFVLASKERVDDELKSIPEKYRCVQQIDNFIGLWDSDFFFIVNDLQILRCLIRDPRMKTKDIAHAIHVSQKTVKRRIDIMLFNRVIDFTIFVNPMEVKGYINVGVFIEIGKEVRRPRAFPSRG